MPTDNKPKNDSASNPGGQELEIQSRYTHSEYGPEDFSQSAINRGQRRINYELTEAAKKLSEALRLLADVLVRTARVGESDLASVNGVIAEAATISSMVAGIEPPGCEPPPPPPPPPPRNEIE